MPNIGPPSLFTREIPHPFSIAGISTTITAFVGRFRKGPTNTAVQIHSFDEFTQIFGGLDDQSEASFGINLYFLNGGTTAWVVRVSGAADEALEAREIIGDRRRKTGIYALEAVDLFNLLCIPDTRTIRASLSPSWQGAPEVSEAAAEYCEAAPGFFSYGRTGWAGPPERCRNAG